MAQGNGQANAVIFTDGACSGNPGPGGWAAIVLTPDGTVKELGAAQARFLVDEQDRELENPAADRGALENLAMMTGGRALAPEQLPELLEQLKHSAHNFEVETQARRTLWDTWPFFLAFIGLLIVEWFLRKRWGLA